MFKVTDKPIDAVRLQQELEGRGVGAVVCFEGRVRDHKIGRAHV